MATRQFDLPPDDAAYLNSLAVEWETLKEGRVRWLLVPNFPLPDGYTADAVTVGLQIPPGYPDAEIDMAFFEPAPTLKSGRAVRAASSVATVGGRAFRRWSRHRTAANPWRPGVDDIATHLTQVRGWLHSEVTQ